jgi:membrane protease YdiL (CAAX protease family)
MLDTSIQMRASLAQAALPIATPSAVRELTEVALGFSLLEVALWNLGWAQVAWGVTALACVLVITLLGTRTSGELGTGATGFRRSCAIIPAAATIGALTVLLAAWGGTLHIAHGLPLWHAGLYATWALVQEFLVQSFIFVRLESVFGGRRAILASATLFATAHLPNPMLIAATFVMGLILTYWFWRHRNIYALGIAHAILGLAVAVALPESATHGMHVGAAFFAKSRPIPFERIRLGPSSRLSARTGGEQSPVGAPSQNR